MGLEIAAIMDSLGWAILHSLWQGTIAAIAVNVSGFEKLKAGTICSALDRSK